jgi:hypothetical protein
MQCTGAMDRTVAQPQVKLRLLRGISFKKFTTVQVHRLILTLQSVQLRIYYYFFGGKELGEQNPSLYKSKLSFNCMQCASEDFSIPWCAAKELGELNPSLYKSKV